MLSKKKKILISSIAILALLAVGCGKTQNSGNETKAKNEPKQEVKTDYKEEKKEDVKDSNTELKWPETISSVEVDLNEELKYKMISIRNVVDADDLYNKIGQLRYLVENVEPSEEYPNYYYWMFELAEAMVKMEQYEIANNYYDVLLGLPGDTVVRAYKRGEEIKEYKKSEYHLEAYGMAAKGKALVHYGMKDRFIEMTKDLKVDEAQIASILGEAYSNLGEKELAYEKFTYGVNPENFKDAYPLQTVPVNISAAAEAYSNGDYDTLKSLTEQFVNLGIDSTDERYFAGYEGRRLDHAKRVWKASYTQTKEYVNLSELAKSGVTGDFNNLKDGTYEGKVMSYMGTEVKSVVTVFDGKVKDIKITQDEPKDDRSSGAFVIIPKKIIEKQSADVDMITGATISSEAVKIATLKAVTQAK